MWMKKINLKKKKKKGIGIVSFNPKLNEESWEERARNYFGTF